MKIFLASMQTMAHDENTMSPNSLARTYSQIQAATQRPDFIKAPTPSHEPYRLLGAIKARKALRFGQRFFALTPEQSKRLAGAESICKKRTA